MFNGNISFVVADDNTASLCPQQAFKVGMEALEADIANSDVRQVTGSSEGILDLNVVNQGLLNASRQGNVYLPLTCCTACSLGASPVWACKNG